MFEIILLWFSYPKISAEIILIFAVSVKVFCNITACWNSHIISYQLAPQWLLKKERLSFLQNVLFSALRNFCTTNLLWIIAVKKCVESFPFKGKPSYQPTNTCLSYKLRYQMKQCLLLSNDKNWSCLFIITVKQVFSWYIFTFV